MLERESDGGGYFIRILIKYMSWDIQNGLVYHLPGRLPPIIVDNASILFEIKFGLPRDINVKPKTQKYQTSQPCKLVFFFFFDLWHLSFLDNTPARYGLDPPKVRL